MKPKVVLCGPCIGEFYWEIGRFAPYIIYLKNTKYKNDVDFIILTKPENFDIYGKHASLLVSLKLKNLDKYKADCFKLQGVSDEEYSALVKTFKEQFSKDYNVLETIYPNIARKQYCNKNQYPENKKLYDYKPREANNILLQKYLNSKPLVVFGPRYRLGFRRNWPYWNNLYDLVWSNKSLMEKYNFIICGKNPDYIPDKKDRFLDINKMEQNINTSLVGLTIECMKKAVLTIGSQSAIPNISLLFKVPVLEWGHQKNLHTITYNPFKTQVTFLEDKDYNIKAEEVFKNILKILK